MLKSNNPAYPLFGSGCCCCDTELQQSIPSSTTAHWPNANLKNQYTAQSCRGPGDITTTRVCLLVRSFVIPAADENGHLPANLT